MFEHQFHWLDVFVSGPLTGNALAVVFGADELDDATMQAFARETNLAETTFIQTAIAPEASYRNRIFTPFEEVPFAGHPSLGTAVAIASSQDTDEGTLLQETASGLTEITVKRFGAAWRATMLQDVEETGIEVAAGEIATAVGVPAEQLDSVRVLSAGIPIAVAVLGRGHDLAAAAASEEKLRTLDKEFGITLVYLLQPAGFSAGERSYAFARSFTHLVPGLEDAATGSAAGPAAVVMEERLGWLKVEIEQGRGIGRPSLIQTRITPNGVEVGGTVHEVIHGTVALPG